MRLEFTAGVNEPGYLPIHSETFTAAKEAWQFLADDFEAQEDLGLEDGRGSPTVCLRTPKPQG